MKEGNLRKVIDTITKSQGSKNLLLYLIFVAISAIFWLLMALNNEVQREYKIPLEVRNVPDSIVIISYLPPEIKVNVREKGSTSVKNMLSKKLQLKMNFDDCTDGNGLMRINSLQLRNAVAQLLGSATTIISISPDSLISGYTSDPPKTVPIKYDIKATPNYQYSVNGSVTVSDDYAYVYGDRELLKSIDYVMAYPIDEKELKDTLVRQIKIQRIAGVKIIPENVTVTIPVVPLISKTATVPIVTRGVPYGVDVITFPSKIGVSYLVPQSEYKQDQNFVAEVYYQDILDGHKKMKLYVNEHDWEYGDIILKADSVDYIIERTNE